MTPEDWASHNAWMLAYGKRLAKGIAEEIGPLPPARWNEGPRLETTPAPYDGGYAGAPYDYRRPIVL